MSMVPDTMKPMVFFLFLLLLHTANACITDEEFRLRGIEPPEEEEDDGLPEGYCSPDEFSKLISKEKYSEFRRRVGKAAEKYSVGCSINKDCIWINGWGWGKFGKESGTNDNFLRVNGVGRGRPDEDCVSKDCIRVDYQPCGRLVRFCYTVGQRTLLRKEHKEAYLKVYNEAREECPCIIGYPKGHTEICPL